MRRTVCKQLLQTGLGLSRLRFSFLIIFLCGSIGYAFAQNRQVTGKVVDEHGESLIGVSILLKGTTSGTVTDIDGNYAISVPANATLAFSYMGYVTQELAVNNRSQINVTMREDTQALDEVIVVGYGVQRKSDVTGAISKVDASDIQNRSIVDANLALQGKTAGVQVLSASGAPGAQTDIRIRGISSNSGSSPLYIVDGMQVRSIGFIDPGNIESMEVLKDAASAAIYGAQAGNGVVLITTKKGSASKQGTITYDGQYVFNSLTRMPKVLNSREYVDYMLEAGYTTQAIIDQFWDGKTDTDWSDVAFENGFSQRHNLSFSQAGEQGSFYSSLSYTKQDGPVVSNKDSYDRWTFLTNADRNIKSWLKVGVNFTYNRSQTKSLASNTEGGSVLGSVLLLDPLTPVYWQESDVPQSYQVYAKDGRLLGDDNGYYAQSQIYIGDNINPLTAVQTSDASGYNNSTMGTAFIEFKPIKGLVATSRLSIQANNRMEKTYDAPYYANSIKGRANPELTRSANESFFYQWENFVNYTRSFGKHTGTAMGGMSYGQTHTEYLATGATRLLKSDPLYRDFNDPLDRNISWIHPDATRTLYGSHSDVAQLSYFGRLDYSYDSKYMLQFTLRSDAFDTSKLSQQARWGYFPAVSAGWTISNEEFMQDIGWLSSLKLRASWGKNGSIRALTGYQYSSAMATAAARQYDFTTDPTSFTYTTAYYPDKLSNAGLKWETSVQLNFGLDARFLNNRMNLTFDWYEKKTDGLLVRATPPLFTGFNFMYVNGGDIKNSGVELELGWNDQVGNFRYGMKGNIATLKNRVTYLDPSITRINGTGFFLTNDYTVMEEGYPIWYMRGYDLLGIDAATGNPQFRDVNGDGLINEEDKTNIGSGLADFTYGLTLTAAYKGFDLVVAGSGSYGNDMYQCLYRPDRINGNRLKIFYDERWTASNTNASRPRAGSNDFDKYIQSSGMIFDGSYFKISQMQLGYTVPRNITSKLKIGNMRAYISFDDWFLFTSYPGFDPSVSVNSRVITTDEVTGSGVGMDKGSYPTYKKTTLGVNITF